MHLFVWKVHPWHPIAAFQVREGLRDVSVEAKCVGVAQQPSGFTFVDLQIVDRRNLAPLTTGSLSHPLQIFVTSQVVSAFLPSTFKLGDRWHFPQ